MYLPQLKECEGCKRMTFGVRKGESCAHNICSSCNQVPYECYQHAACLKCYQDLPYCKICCKMCSNCNKPTYTFTTCENGHNTCPECPEVPLECGNHFICKPCMNSKTMCNLCFKKCIKCKKMKHALMDLNCNNHRVCEKCFSNGECILCLNQCFKCKIWGYDSQRYKKCPHYYCIKEYDQFNKDKCEKCLTCQNCKKINNSIFEQKCQDCIKSSFCSNCNRVDQVLKKNCQNHFYCNQCSKEFDNNCPLCSYHNLISGKCEICNKTASKLKNLKCEKHKSCVSCFTSKSGNCIISSCSKCNQHESNIFKFDCNHSLCEKCLKPESIKKCNLCCETCKNKTKNIKKLCNQCKCYFCNECWGNNPGTCKKCIHKCEICENLGLKFYQDCDHILCSEHYFRDTDDCRLCKGELLGAPKKCKKCNLLIEIDLSLLDIPNNYIFNNCLSCQKLMQCTKCHGIFNKSSFQNNSKKCDSCNKVICRGCRFESHKNLVNIEFGFCEKCAIERVCGICKKNTKLSCLNFDYEKCRDCLVSTVYCSNCMQQVHYTGINENECYEKCRKKVCLNCNQYKLFKDFDDYNSRVCSSCLKVQEIDRYKLNNSICSNCGLAKSKSISESDLTCRCDELCYICKKYVEIDPIKLDCEHSVCKKCLMPSSINTENKCVKCQNVYYCEEHNTINYYSKKSKTKIITCCNIKICLNCYRLREKNHIC